MVRAVTTNQLDGEEANEAHLVDEEVSIYKSFSANVILQVEEGQQVQKIFSMPSIDMADNTSLDLGGSLQPSEENSMNQAQELTKIKNMKLDGVWI